MYSRKIVDETFRLKAQGLTDKAIAEQCGVSVQAIRHWRYGTRRSPATETDRTTYCPRCSGGTIHEEAYAYVLGAYLGDGHIVEIKRKPGLHTLSVFYDNKYPQLVSYCQTAIESVFPIKAFRVKRNGCTEIKAYSKHWTCVFPQHGKGYKHSRPIALEPWQQRIVDEHPKAFIRGLIHSDGCRLNNRVRRKLTNGDVKHHVYPRYQFVNTSTGIIALFTTALDRVGVEWKSHISKREPRYRDAHIVSISRQDAVARMDTFVGPKY